MSTPNRTGAGKRLWIAGLVLLGLAAIAVVIGVIDFANGEPETAASARPSPPATVAPASESAPPSIIPYPPPEAVSPTPAPGVGGGLAPDPLEPGTAGQGSGTVVGPDASAGAPSGKVSSRGEVRVYNNSTIHGLAARAAGDLTAAGWTVVEVGNYSAGQIPTTTTYYQEGTDQRSDAEAIGTEFRTRVEPRFPGIAHSSPGLIMIVTNDYKSP